jgi:hypothetical protein
MKSKDQHLLEEAYNRILKEGRPDDPRLNVADYSNRRKEDYREPKDNLNDLRNRERNAGLENDYVPSPSVTQTAPAVSTPKPEQPINVDLSKLADKKINAVVWDYPDYVITVDQKPIGTMLSKADAERIVGVLNSKDGESLGTPLLQNWYKSAVKDLEAN